MSIALGLVALGVALLTVHWTLFVRARLAPTAKHVSAVPVLGGALIATGMLCMPGLRCWAWVPLLADPAGVVPFALSLRRQR